MTDNSLGAVKTLSPQIGLILAGRFGQPALIALATEENGAPFVRNVTACYKEGAFYLLTQARSAKVRQMAANPAVALAGQWFSAQGRAVDLGDWRAAENRPMAEKLAAALSGWLREERGAGGETLLLFRIDLTAGQVTAEGVHYSF